MSESEHDAFRALLDDASFEAIDGEVPSSDPLSYPGYAEQLQKARASSGRDESVTVGEVAIGRYPVVLALFDFAFLGGSMGEVPGERLARGMEEAALRRIPFVLYTATGGARMQEGMRALVQMPKVVAARIALGEAKVPFIAVLGHPTTGGVLASVGSLADVTVAESNATIGFAGPRVARRFSGTRLSGASHTSTSAFHHGLVDEIVPRSDALSFVFSVLDVLSPDEPSPATPTPAAEPRELDGWDAVERARSADRVTAPDLARSLLDPLVELRGDRAGTDDPALVVLLGRCGGRRVVVLALDRAHAPGPGAFRKARRALAIAERLGLPAVTLVDTRGADPTEASENSGIAWEIAALFEAILSVDVRVLAIVTGEGGSGGALAFAAGDVLLAYDDSIFSVIGPEGAAEILWRDGTRAAEAARLLKLTAADLVRLGIADGTIPGPPEAGQLREVVAYHLGRLAASGSGPASRRKRWRDAP